jgi:hypothetical protein
MLLSVASAALVAAALAAAPPSNLTSEVRRDNGMPALFVNGKLTSTVTYYTKTPQDVPPFTQAGLDINNFSVPFGWVGPQSYDFTKTDALLDQYLKADPKMLILPRFSIQPGEWWCKQFPNEITLRGDGTPAFFRAPRSADPQVTCRPSFASEKYRELAHGALRAFLAHMEEKYGSHVVGYFPGNGVYN